MIRDGQPPVQVRSGFEPFAVTLISALLLWSTTTLLALSEVSGTTAQAFPKWAVYVFFGGMVIGALTFLSGIALERLRATTLGVHIERAGLTGLLGLALTYSVWVWMVSGVRGLSFIYLMAAVWTGASWRNLLITIDLRRAKRGAR